MERFRCGAGRRAGVPSPPTAQTSPTAALAPSGPEVSAAWDNQRSPVSIALAIGRCDRGRCLRLLTPGQSPTPGRVAVPGVGTSCTRCPAAHGSRPDREAAAPPTRSRNSIEDGGFQYSSAKKPGGSCDHSSHRRVGHATRRPRAARSSGVSSSPFRRVTCFGYWCRRWSVAAPRRPAAAAASACRSRSRRADSVVRCCMEPAVHDTTKLRAASWLHDSGEYRAVSLHVPRCARPGLPQRPVPARRPPAPSVAGAPSVAADAEARAARACSRDSA